MDISDDAFAWFVRWLQSQAGISLRDDQRYLVKSRLAPIFREVGWSSLDEVSRQQYSADFQSIQQRLIDAMTTNETSFFRDPSFWTMMREHYLPEAYKNLKRVIKVWCAAASTGQEPYSLAMAAVETQENIVISPVNQLRLSLVIYPLKRLSMLGMACTINWK